MKRIFLALALGASSTCALAAEALDPTEVEFFEKKIRPVLVEQCYKCHSSQAKEIKGKLRLDTRESLRAGGATGPAIVVGDPKKSLLMEALRHDGLEMPPNKKLPAEVIADFERWITRGAVDPRVEAVATNAVKKEIDWPQARKFWSFQPIANTPLPAVKNAAWPRSDLDYYVLAKLEASQLTPVADADRVTLLRRLSFDLTGLPPPTAEIELYLADESPAATEHVVDRLLASPHFGEHWGRHWLDVARYAESNGNVDNFLFPHAWRYRDYVIDSLNADKPLDQFITEQVAGDLLPARDWRQKNELVTATGFLALTSKPRPQNNPDYALDLVAEQIEATTVAFMGLTVACARCHDHKFDPIPQREYYSLAAIFESTNMLHGGGDAKKGNKYAQKSGLHTLTSDDPALAEKISQQEAKVAALRTEQAQVRKEVGELIASARRIVLGKGSSASAAPVVLAAGETSEKEQKKLEKQLQRAEEHLDDVQKKRLQTARDRLAALDSKIKELEKSTPAAGFAMGVVDAEKPVEGRIRIRGESQKVGDTVPRGFVTVGSLGTPPPLSPEHSGRLELAHWITSRDNPLTARVMANRVWRHLFGRGLVSTVDNFGALGERPSHPELLDHLATQLVAEGWSLKKLIRSIVLSRAYQLSSRFDAKAMEVDPDDALLWRHSVRRLDGESLRDAILAAADTLDRNPGQGSTVSARGDAEAKNGVDREFVKFENAHRSIYLPIVRNAEPELLATFDLPDSELVVGSRSVTTVPAQSLLLMNSPWIVKQSTALAERLLAQRELSDRERIARLYRTALAREPQAAEYERITAFLAAEAKSSDSPGVSGWARVAHAVLASAEFRYVE